MIRIDPLIDVDPSTLQEPDYHGWGSSNQLCRTRIPALNLDPGFDGPNQKQEFYLEDTSQEVKVLETITEALTDRVVVLEDNVTILQTDVTQLQTDVTQLQTDVTQLQGDVTTIQGDITTIQGNITTIQGDITTLQNDVTQLQSDVADLQALGPVKIGPVTTGIADGATADPITNTVRLNIGDSTTPGLISAANQEMSGVKSFLNGIRLPTFSGSNNLLDYCEIDFQFTTQLDFVGGSTITSMTIRGVAQAPTLYFVNISMIGNRVTILMPRFTINTASGSPSILTTTLGIPDRFRPKYDTTIPNIQFNIGQYTLRGLVYANGIIQFKRLDNAIFPLSVGNEGDIAITYCITAS